MGAARTGWGRRRGTAGENGGRGKPLPYDGGWNGGAERRATVGRPYGVQARDDAEQCSALRAGDGGRDLDSPTFSDFQRLGPPRASAPTERTERRRGSAGCRGRQPLQRGTRRRRKSAGDRKGRPYGEDGTSTALADDIPQSRSQARVTAPFRQGGHCLRPSVSAGWDVDANRRATKGRPYGGVGRRRGQIGVCS